MTARPHHDAASILTDGRRLLALAREDVAQADFAARLGAHELDDFASALDALERGDGARSATLHAKVAAGVQAAHARAALLAVLLDVRDDAKIRFGSDAQLQHAFGVGATPNAASTSQVRRLADEVLAAAAAHPSEASQLGLDEHGLHALEDLVHALDGADVAHQAAASNRHTNATALDSLAHRVAAEAAHLRLVARRVFRSDKPRRDRYAPTLPRHEVVHRGAAV